MQEIAGFTAKLVKKKLLTEDVVELKFKKPPDFDYKAGQFLQWIIKKGDKNILRCYSLSSAPGEESLDFCVKILPDGSASKIVEKMKPGETLSFQGPRGMFVSEENNRNLYFVATGVGLAPIMGIIKDQLIYKKTDAEINLLFGVRSEDDIFWQTELENLKSKHQNFTYEITLSQPKIGGGWSGLRGRVTEHVLHHLVEHRFYLCGNAAMVKDVRKILIDNGINPQNIHFEIF